LKSGIPFCVALFYALLVGEPVVLNQEKEKHPTYVAVVQVDYNHTDKSASLLCKAFPDDLQKALQKQFTNQRNIADSGNTAILSSEIDAYVKSHLQIKINGHAVPYSFLRYDIEPGNAVALSFRINNIDGISSIEITDSIFYELFASQIQIIYITVDGNRKSAKLRNPDSKASFDF